MMEVCSNQKDGALPPLGKNSCKVQRDGGLSISGQRTRNEEGFHRFRMPALVKAQAQQPKAIGASTARLVMNDNPT
jgi:hypothetical protein